MAWPCTGQADLIIGADLDGLFIHAPDTVHTLKKPMAINNK